MAFKFEQLKFWQRGIDLNISINELVKSWPREELYSLTNQIKRAADSVILNIAEGSTGQSNKEFLRFLSYSLRSAVEVEACLHIAKSRHYVNEETFSIMYVEIEEIIKMIQGLKRSIKTKV